MANFAVVRAVQAVLLAFVLAGSLGYLYFLATPVSLLTDSLDD